MLSEINSFYLGFMAVMYSELYPLQQIRASFSAELPSDGADTGYTMEEHLI